MAERDSVIIGEKQKIGAGFEMLERLVLKGTFRIEKYLVKKSGKKLIETLEWSNLTTNVGGALLLDLFTGAGGTAFNNSNARIGVGDSNTAPAVGQTDLQAATNKLRKAMEATFPSRAAQIVTFQSVFGTTDANWAWEEMALFNSSSGATMFCRSLVSAPFTKTSALSITAKYLLNCP